MWPLWGKAGNAKPVQPGQIGQDPLPASAPAIAPASVADQHANLFGTNAAKMHPRAATTVEHEQYSLPRKDAKSTVFGTAVDGEPLARRSTPEVDVEDRQAAREGLMVIVGIVIVIGFIAANALKDYKCEWMVGGFCGAVLIECYRASYSDDGNFEHVYSKAYNGWNSDSVQKINSAIVKVGQGNSKSRVLNIFVACALVTAIVLVLVFGAKK